MDQRTKTSAGRPIARKAQVMETVSIAVRDFLLSVALDRRRECCADDAKNGIASRSFFVHRPLPYLLDVLLSNASAFRQAGNARQKFREKIMLSCIPYLLFDGDCAEAMSFYHECIGGKLMLTKLGDTPMKAQFPSEKHGRIINAQIECGPFKLSASDWMASPAFEPVLDNRSAVFVVGTSRDELKPVFDKLAAGADRERFQELHSMPFGTYGQFYDKYGVQWIFRGNAE